jgi:hypothetical protein
MDPAGEGMVDMVQDIFSCWCGDTQEMIVERETAKRDEYVKMWGAT